MRPLGLAALGLFLITGAAYATGNVSCSAEDAVLSFTAEANVPYERGRPFMGLRAGAEVKSDAAPKVFRRIAFARSDLVHHWLDKDRGEVRMLFYRESRRPAGSLELLVGATYDPGEPDGEGDYVLTLRMPPKQAGGEETVTVLKGKTTCGAD